MSYWHVGDKVMIGQSEIELTAEGASDFQENQVVGIFIPPSIELFSGKDCYLNFDVKLDQGTTGITATSPHPTKITLDGLIGANSLFSQARVYAGNRGKILEETQEYSSWVSCKYSYETNDSIKAKRALTEGCGVWAPETRGTCGTTKSVQNNHTLSPYNEQANLGILPETDILKQTAMTTAKVSLQLHLGVFANNPKAFPNVLTKGCYVELTCAPNRQVFRRFDSVTKNKLLGLNPYLRGSTEAGADFQTGKAQAVDSLFLEIANTQLNTRSCPFKVGERLELVDIRTGNVVALQNKTDDGPAVIQAIKQSNDYIELVIGQAQQAGSPAPALVPGVYHLDAGDLTGNAFEYVFASSSLESTTVGFNPTYTISNVRLNVKRIDVDAQFISGMVSKMKEGGEVVFDLPCINTQLHSTMAGDLQGTIPISIEHTKARSIIAMPTDAKPYSALDTALGHGTYVINTDEGGALTNGAYNHSDRPAISGIGDYLSNYNFMIEGKQVPSRRINTSKTTSKNGGIDANHLIELEKALIQCHNCEPLSFADFRNNFLIGRALTLSTNTIFDGRGKDCRLNVRYEGTAPEKDKLWKMFIHHIKTVSVKGDDINVVN